MEMAVNFYTSQQLEENRVWWYNTLRRPYVPMTLSWYHLSSKQVLQRHLLPSCFYGPSGMFPES